MTDAQLLADSERYLEQSNRHDIMSDQAAALSQRCMAASLLVIARNSIKPPLTAAEHQAIADLHRVRKGSE